jgi:membrane-bound metal-dependent hydrolase YbcI (DUF457 family)
MAGAFTHFVVCDQAKANKNKLGKDLWQLLNKYYYFLYLGGVGPDLPYLSLNMGSVNWANVMHYEKTNSIFETGHAALKTSWTSKTELEEASFVWLLGYLSHLITDATIHPVVQAIVGPYEQNKEEHRICEMTQDSVIYNIHRNGDIRYTEFSEMIRYCGESKVFGKVMDFWKDQLALNYSEKGEESPPPLWFTTYKEAIDLAEGGSALVAIFRHAGIGTGFIYKTRAEIEDNFQSYYVKYFEKTKLPSGQVGTFTDVFQKTLDNVLVAWKSAYDNLIADAQFTGLVKNWNLDTGVDTDSQDQEVTYWT